MKVFRQILNKDGIVPSYMPPSLIDKISSEYKSLTLSQRKVAEYILHNLNEVILLNSTDLAKITNVSESTISRLVTKIGYSGFSEFKREISRFVFREFLTPKKLAKSVKTFDEDGSILNRIVDGDIENIQRLARDNSDRTFEEAVTKICSAKAIYILGLRSSYSLAFYLAFNLRFFLKSVNLLKLGTGDIPEQIHDAGRKDILIAISFRRFTRDTVKIAEQIKRRGTYVISITDHHLSPIAQIADITLLAKVEIPSYFGSHTAPMCLINALITGIALREKHKALPALSKLELVFEELQTYTKEIR